jgi:MoaA/NifB/PqqE/SkfB family radical SAM enzyme
MESFKTGADFDQVVGVIRALAASTLRPVLGTVFVLHKNNCHELPEYVDFVNGLGVKTVYLTNLLSFTPQFKDWYLYTPHGNAEVEEIFRDTVSRVRKNGQTIWLPSMQPQDRGCTQCQALFIDQRGDVFPCDLLSVGTPFEMFGACKQNTPASCGNVFKEDALQIYRSPALAAFRTRHRKGGCPPDQCSHCIDAYSIMCSHRERFA